MLACDNAGMTEARVSIQTQDFDLSAEIAALRTGDARVGAVCSFVGTVRDRNEGDAVASMELEHYPGMTEKSLEALVEEARRRWSLIAVTVIHRVGRLMPGERIVFVGVASRHRADAFAACEFLIDRLKTEAPFWKKEETEGVARWVEARESDEKRARRW